MILIEKDLYVMVREMQGPRAPQPKPLPNGFSGNVAYRVLGMHCASETSEAYLILANDREELWFISNKHLRAYGLFPGCTQMSFPAETTDGAPETTLRPAVRRQTPALRSAG